MCLYRVAGRGRLRLSLFENSTVTQREGDCGGWKRVAAVSNARETRREKRGQLGSGRERAGALWSEKASETRDIWTQAIRVTAHERLASRVLRDFLLRGHGHRTHDAETTRFARSIIESFPSLVCPPSPSRGGQCWAVEPSSRAPLSMSACVTGMREIHLAPNPMCHGNFADGHTRRRAGFRS